jgi:hypothetical protein
MDEVTRETWRAIPGYEGSYEVSDLGRVRSHLEYHGTSERILAQPRSHGYGQVALRRDGQSQIWLVHRLVLLAFVGTMPAGQETRHGPGGRKDNRLVNLCYGTRAENIADRVRDGGQRQADVRNEKNPRAKLTMQLAAQIRERRAAGDGITAMAREYGVGVSTIKRVLTGECWAHGLVT